MPGRQIETAADASPSLSKLLAFARMLARQAAREFLLQPHLLTAESADERQSEDA